MRSSTFAIIRISAIMLVSFFAVIAQTQETVGLRPEITFIEKTSIM